jgi:hypothetical protein
VLVTPLCFACLPLPLLILTTSSSLPTSSLESTVKRANDDTDFGTVPKSSSLPSELSEKKHMFRLIHVNVNNDF